MNNLHTKKRLGIWGQWHSDMCISTFCDQSLMAHQDVTACHTYVYQDEPLRKSEMGLIAVLVFQVSRNPLVPSLPRTSSPEEPPIRTLSFCLDTVLCMRWLLVPSYVPRNRSRFFKSMAEPCSLCLWGDPFLRSTRQILMIPMSARRTNILYALWDGSLCLIFCKVDPFYLQWSARQIPTQVCSLLLISLALEIVIPSLRWTLPVSVLSHDLISCPHL